MKSTQLSLATLHMQCPDLANQFDRVLKELVMDCRERPGVSKDRKMTIAVHVKPHPNDPEDVLLYPVMGSRRPAVEFEAHRLRTSRSNQLIFDFGDAEAA